MEWRKAKNGERTRCKAKDEVMNSIHTHSPLCSICKQYKCVLYNVIDGLWTEAAINNEHTSHSVMVDIVSLTHSRITSEISL